MRPTKLVFPNQNQNKLSELASGPRTDASSTCLSAHFSAYIRVAITVAMGVAAQGKFIGGSRALRAGSAIDVLILV